ncbi:cyclic nucleotide-binding domain-containing protein [Rhodopila sp.]|uniref:cyclic nucleotide-binding domain-containing protein n=1 Tax=Rhodopila sp. TaxID=2480087 RepID=UPI002D7E1FD9|nr:cyclic nucleotide-binding domain-containing protein [Rhodopila sp.]
MRATPLLNELAEPSLNRLAGISRVIRVAEGTLLCEEGEPASELFIVLDGQVAVLAQAANGTSAVVEVLDAGATMGLSAVLAGLPLLMTARVVRAARLLSIDGEGLRALTAQEPPLVTVLLRAEAEGFKALVQQVCDLKLRTTAQRLAVYLLSLSPEKSGNTTALRLPFDKRLLAARLGCRQENLSRAFAALRTLGVETHGARVILHDIARLRDYALPDDSMGSKVSV